MKKKKNCFNFGDQFRVDFYVAKQEHEQQRRRKCLVIPTLVRSPVWTAAQCRVHLGRTGHSAFTLDITQLTLHIHRGRGPGPPGGGTKLCGRSSTSKNSTAFACSLRTASVYFDCLLQYLIRREHHAYRCQSIAESSFAFGDFLGFFSIFSTHGWLNLWM